MSDYQRVLTVSVVDSFTLIKNSESKGHGEAKLYICSEDDSETRSFIEATTASTAGTVKKHDLQSYLECAKPYYEEYSSSHSVRSKDFSHMQLKDYFNHAQTIVSRLSASENFQVEIVPSKNRIYVRPMQKDGNRGFQAIREVCLPRLTSLEIQRYDEPGKINLLFRPYLNQTGSPFREESEEKVIKAIEQDQSIDRTDREQLIIARNGQGVFRARVMVRCPNCPITGIGDERLLIASHIKPWRVSTNQERLDGNNGIMLSPTIDRLFDLGLLTFDDDGNPILSSSLTREDIRRTSLDNPPTISSILNEGVKVYLRYHRERVFNP